MEIINKVLRVLVYSVLSIILLILTSSIIYGFIQGVSTSFIITDEMVILFISLSLILFIFNKNKSSKIRYNTLLLAMGIFIICEKYMFFIYDSYKGLHEVTFTQYILSMSSIIDIVPLCLVYLSTICTYLTCRKRKQK